jgi:hypothetical protein
MQPNVVLNWQSFIIAKGGCYRPTPLKGISPMRFKSDGKKLWVIYSKFFFMLPGSFAFGMVTPLHLAHLDDLAANDSFCCIQNPYRSLIVCQINS